MNELHKTYSILEKLEALNNSKFNASLFISLNSELQVSLDNFIKNREDNNKKYLSIEDKKTVTDLITKIEFLEGQFMPKADLINSFSNSLK
jgi:hypothetical protein